jgi:circadian clock protein KaiC
MESSYPGPQTCPAEGLATGVAGLDEVLGGGLARERLYLVLGESGAGKTTLGLQFLLEGVRQGEPCLYVSFAETTAEIAALASSHGWSLGELEVYEFPAEGRDRGMQTILLPAEVELQELLRPLLDAIDRRKPCRTVIDSMSELRLLAKDPLRFRQQVLQLKRRLTQHGGVVLLLDDVPLLRAEAAPQTFAHGVIELDLAVPDYGVMRRRLLVHKLRAARFREGWHDYRIETGGLVVYPRLLASEGGAAVERGAITSGDEALDRLVGHVSQGATVLLVGAAGTGKSTLVAQYVRSAAAGGEGAAVFLFDERRETFLGRAAATGSDIGPYLDEGRVTVQAVNPAEIPPGQLTALVREAVEARGARFVVIDSLDGYLASTPGERFSTLYMREMLTWLGRRGVTAILTLVQHDVGVGPTTEINLSYLSDVVILLRFFEAAGRVRRALSVVKNRTDQHGPSICEVRIDEKGMHTGEPLIEFRGVLTGTPVYLGTEAQLDATEGHERRHP